MFSFESVRLDLLESLRPCLLGTSRVVLVEDDDFEVFLFLVALFRRMLWIPFIISFPCNSYGLECFDFE